MMLSGDDQQSWCPQRGACLPAFPAAATYSCPAFSAASITLENADDETIPGEPKEFDVIWAPISIAYSTDDMMLERNPSPLWSSALIAMILTLGAIPATPFPAPKMRVNHAHNVLMYYAEEE